MHIKFIEIQNFRKLKSVHVAITPNKTIFVGANNSGKTSAMSALSHFLINTGGFTINDLTLSNWIKINSIGKQWADNEKNINPENLTINEWEGALPSIDIWFEVADNEVHYVSHLIPTLDWQSGLIGVRLRFEPRDPGELFKNYIAALNAAKDTKAAAQRLDEKERTANLWPTDLISFLQKRLHSHFGVRHYILDPDKCVPPDNGVASPQSLYEGAEALGGDPLKGLIRIDEINAQRGFGNSSGNANSDDSLRSTSGSYWNTRRLSSQLRSYYDSHLDPLKSPQISDIDAIEAIESAEDAFNDRLTECFKSALQELEGLGYPGLTDPKLTISTRFRPTDGLNHEAAVQYVVISNDGKDSSAALRLPEDHNGLGYQNLISMVFRLMSFRDSWMQVGKAGKGSESSTDSSIRPPIHLVLVEEPEAHLHAQVQQVFIRRAYEVLRNHNDLGDGQTLTTQLIVSTHSSHVAHECKYESLRYFRRYPAHGPGEVPTAQVVNLSEVFGPQVETERFVSRYLLAAHCDLFFADAVIMVEGPAERMLVPHFIRLHYPKLDQRYVTILEIGGSHAHRLRTLIEHLGLLTLIITDLDAALATGNHPSAQPQRGQDLITGNTTLASWVPEIKLLDTLLDLPDAGKEKAYQDFFSVRAAYQCPIIINDISGLSGQEFLPYTFEDSLVVTNLSLFRTLDGQGLIKGFKDAIQNAETAIGLGEALSDCLKKGSKASFSLDLLYLRDPMGLDVPTYIDDGLKWLQEKLEIKQSETLLEPTSPDLTP